MKSTWKSNFGVHSFLEIQPHSIYVLSTASSTLQWQSCVVVTSTLWPENLKDFLSGLLQKRFAACYLCTCCLLSPECPSLACPHGQSARSRAISSLNSSFLMPYRVSSSQSGAVTIDFSVINFLYGFAVISSMSVSSHYFRIFQIH